MRCENNLLNFGTSFTQCSASGMTMFDYLFIALITAIVALITAIVKYVFDDIANWTTVFWIFYAVDLVRVWRGGKSVLLIPIRILILILEPILIPILEPILIPIINFLYRIQAQFIYEILPFLILLFIIGPLRMAIEIFTVSKKK